MVIIDDVDVLAAAGESAGDLERHISALFLGLIDSVPGGVAILGMREKEYAV